MRVLNFDIKGFRFYIFIEKSRKKRSNLFQSWIVKSKVHGASGPHILTDLVSLVRFALDQENELVPFPEKVGTNFNAWIAQQEKRFTEEQKSWLYMIKDHIAGNLSIDTEDFEYAPFSQEGGIGRVYQVFGDDLNKQLVA